MAGPSTLTSEGAFDYSLRTAINNNFADSVSQTRTTAQTIAGPLNVGSGVTPTVYAGTTDAILFPNAVNLAIVTPASGTNACTLATPVAADNGKLLYVINGTAGANTITTASGKILDGSASPKDTATFAAHIGATVVFMAYNLFWQQISLSNCTLTAV